MALKWTIKDPNEVLDFEIDWTARIGTADPIETVTWTIPSGITKTAQTFEGLVTAVWLSGGTTGASYSVGCLVETEGGRIFDQTVILPVKTR